MLKVAPFSSYNGTWALFAMVFVRYFLDKMWCSGSSMALSVAVSPTQEKSTLKENWKSEEKSVSDPGFKEEGLWSESKEITFTFSF